jgi:hypothetical protein
MTTLPTRRQFVAGIFAALGGLQIVSGESARRGKKGWAGGDPAMHEQFRAHWYYTWMPRSPSPSTAEFVPMTKGAAGVKQAGAIEQLPDITHLLGFNEPERAEQGNVPLNEALDLWPQLEAIATKRNLRLGSPATSSDKKGMDWFEAFMAQAKKRKLRIDFIALHWYRGRNAAAFASFVSGISRAHRLPVWVTEFNGWNGTEPENFDFLKRALAFLESSREVERYAYFNTPAGTPLSLLAADGSLTRMGKLYRDT